MSSLPGTENQIRGTNGNDTIIGTAADDLIRALGGSDAVDALDGDDYLEGGAGNDTMFGGTGDDWLIGGLGNDVYNGGTGADQFRFYGTTITGAGTANPGHDIDTVEDLSFAEGDILAISGFAAGIFKGTDLNGQLDIIRNGSETNVRSWAGLVDLVASSPALSVARQPNTDTLLLTITNADGAKQTIAIQNGWSIYSSFVNTAPVAANDAASVLEDASTSGNVLANDSDANVGDTLSVTALKPAAGSSQAVAASGTTVVTGAYGSIAIQANGAYSYAALGAAAQALSAGQVVQDVFTYTVTDSKGATATAQLVVQVTGTNDAPVAQALTGTVLENGPALKLTPNFQDPDQGDTHTITVNTAGTVGKVTLNGDGTFSYDANGKFESLKAGQSATDTFTYTVKDAAGATSTKTVTMTIQGQNDAPVAVGDFNGVVKNGSMSVAASKGVLANDTDADLNSLAVSTVNGSSSGVGTALQGKYGTLTMAADGSYSYVANTKPGALPAKGVAQDHFSYTVSDGSTAQTERLTITVYDKGQTYTRGTDGNDSLSGGNGSDVLDGGNGNDILVGGNGPDALLGGRGNDFLTGGSGPDTFVFNAQFGNDTITDFGSGDLIQFDTDVFASYASMIAAATQSGNNVIIDAGNGNVITLQDVLLSNLKSSDFLFV